MSEPNSPPVVSVVTVNYRIADVLASMIASVPAAMNDLPHEIIVVDNASNDGSVETIKRTFPSVRLIANSENLGFAGGNNTAARVARGDYLAFVNPDVVLDEGSIAALAGELRTHPDVGLIGPKILLPDGSVQSFAGELPSFRDVLEAVPGRLFVRRSGANGHAGADPQPCGLIHGACMVMSRRAFDAVGGIPSETFMYGEEPLLGHRLAAAGFRVWYDPRVAVRHADGSSANRAFEPHEKALKKRWGHAVARAEILPRPTFYAWNVVMAFAAAARGVRSALARDGETAAHADFVRLHLRALRAETSRTKSRRST